ncbi:MAG: hypothetical protein ACQEQO_07785 [Thermodesulfobacteriota bacterium]
MLKRPTREPWPPARLCPGGDSAPEGTEKKPIVFVAIMKIARFFKGLAFIS